MNKPKAVTAAAHKLARLMDSVLTKGEETTDQRAQQLGMTLVPTAPAAQAA